MDGSKLEWDTEDRHQLVSREVRIRDNQIYVPSGLISTMEDAWNCVLTHIKTSTDPKTGEVTIGRADPKEPGAVAVRRVGAQNAAVVNFWRPLQKLKLKIPANRQFLVDPVTRELDGIGIVFVLSMKNRVSVPRNLKEESEEEATAEPKKEPQAATPAPTPAENEAAAAKAESAATDAEQN